MIEAAAVTTQLSPQHLNKGQVSSLSYTESGRVEQQQQLLFSSDQVNLSYSVESVLTYNSSLTVEGAIQDGYELLRSMVQRVFSDQGIDNKIVVGDSETIDISELSQEDAQQLVAEDGYFGVEKTSERIFQFAIGVAGGDPTRLDAIMEGVEKGFQEALEAFGGWLPDISYDTYDAVIGKLNHWADNHGQQLQA